MRLPASTAPVIVEVRANEYAARDGNEHVPYGAQAMIADALACVRAGAASYHWHTRGDDGVDRPDDAGLQREVIAGIRKTSDMMLHPSLGFSSTQGDAAARLAHLDELLAGEHRPDIVPIDFGAFVSDEFDRSTDRFTTLDAVLLNRTGYLEDLARGISERGVAILAVVWSPGGIRTARHLIERGDISVPVYWQLGFTGERVPGGPPATVKQLEAFLDELPAGAQWNVHVRDGDGLPMAVAAILHGGHVSIGLGDDPYLRLGRPTNADLVGAIADAATVVGRPLASPEQARQMLGFPALTAVQRPA